MAIPLIVLWGTISHAVYVTQLHSILARIILGSIGISSGIIAIIAYFQVWIQGPGTPLLFDEFVVGDLEVSAGRGIVVPEVLNESVEARYDGKVRYCKHCNVFKPDRTHHCRQCGVCIIRMDHHCPWFTTCIGLYNHKYFIQFMAYTWVLCSCADIVGIPYLVSFIRDKRYYSELIDKNELFYVVLSAMFFLVITFFGGYTVMLAVENRTTLESMEAIPYRTSLPASQWRYRYPPNRENLGNIYDMGRKENWNQIFGDTWRDWLLPVKSPLRYDGRFFPFNEDLRKIAEERAQTEISMRERKRVFSAPREHNSVLESGAGPSYTT